MQGTLADVVVVVHMAFLIYVAFGGFLAIGRPWLLLPHLVTVLWGVLGAGARLGCPLTQWEKDLRRAAGEPAYPDSFIGYYLEGGLFPEGVRPVLWTVAAIGILTSYVLVLRHETRRQGRVAAGAAATPRLDRAAGLPGTPAPRDSGPIAK
jgi:hypothetical protein